MNKTIMAGRLTKDPEVRYTQGGLAVAKFGIAVDRKGAKKGDEVTADFFNCVAFGKTAEVIEKYLGKGRKVLLVGRFENNNYTDKNGNKVYSFQFVVDEMEFMDSKQQSQQQSNDQPADGSGWLNIPDGIQEELPFN